jgi:hypothetical protein
MDDERRPPQDYLLSTHYQFRPHKSQQPTRADPLVSIRQLPYMPMQADVFGCIKGPRYRECGVRDQLECEQDNCIFGEDEVEREAEA